MITNHIINGYQVSEEIYNSSRTVVYRAVRQSDNLPVVIKLLKNSDPSFNELIKFHNQYAIAKNLHLPGIIQIYSLEIYQNRYALIMEDFGGISLKDLPQINKAKVISLQEFLYLAISLCETLDALIHHHIIHQDIQPANILINPHTQQVKLIDFGLASVLPRETPTSINPQILAATRAYLSPEQTGWMNRSVDYRTDFYSLGITFYELLTGELPFSAVDSMEFLHDHLLVHEINHEIPYVISQIINKLMAKKAEDRYQSACGLKFDLEKCLLELQSTGTISEFAIAQQDTCVDAKRFVVRYRFLIPEQLYGREKAIETLLKTFYGVSQGATTMLLVTGVSGVGKTAVIKAVYQPVIKQRGYFIQGEYNQFNLHIPFSGLVQALQDLIRQLLKEHEDNLQIWRNKILAAVGNNGQLLIDIIPELVFIIGKQSPVIQLTGIAAENRWNSLLQDFIQVFTSAEHPLVIFLDNLQWADAASLKLIELLIKNYRHLCLIGAACDQEVSQPHPLLLNFLKIAQKSDNFHTLNLAPLTLEQVNQLVADTLKCPENIALPLSQLLFQQTQGNPLFTTQFLKALYEDGWIQFNQQQGYWQCDTAQLSQQPLTKEVVALIAMQLCKLPDYIQELLKLAACLGKTFDLATLAMVSQASQAETATFLWKALQSGFILPMSDDYKFYLSQETQEIQPHSQTASYQFLHECVQQAAYSLIDRDSQAAIHLQIGQRWLNYASPDQREQHLLAIVNHLNLGIPLITTANERENLANLNLAAGRKAIATMDYGAAIAYSSTGIALLPTTAWESHYPLMLALHEAITEASFLNNDFTQMEQWAIAALPHIRTLLDTSKLQQTRILAAQSQGRYSEAIQMGLSLLHLLGIEFPEQPTQEDISEAFGLTRSLWINQPIHSLLDLPAMSDRQILVAMDILAALVNPAYTNAPTLMPLLIFKQVELSIRFGNCPISISAYSEYGLILCGIIGDIEIGYEFGELALSLQAQLPSDPLLARNSYVVHSYIKHWHTPLSTNIPALQAAYQMGIETGDIEIACLSATTACFYAYYAGQELTELAQKMAVYSRSIHQHQQTIAIACQDVHHQAVLNLLGQAKVPYRLSGQIFHQETSLAKLHQINLRPALFMWYMNQTILYYLFGKNEEAAQTSAQIGQYIDGVVALFIVPIYCFFDSLIQFSQYATATPEARHSILLQVQQHQNKLNYWANFAPQNHQHRCELVAAEQYRVLGNKAEAIKSYDRAIALAKESHYIQDEALANELAAKFYLDWGKERVACGYMQEAYSCYVKWGAKAKTDDLEQRYPQLLTRILQSAPRVTQPETCANVSDPAAHITSKTPPVLDFDLLQQFSQFFHSEVHLARLGAKFMEAAIAHTDVDKGALMINYQGSLAVVIQYDQQQLQPFAVNSLDSCVDLPLSIIRYVEQTLELTVTNADIPDSFAADPYFSHHNPQNLLCIPILQSEQLIGLLYLENSLTQQSFSCDRLETLHQLCNQAAIYLENASRYHTLEQKFMQLTSEMSQILDELQATQKQFAESDTNFGF